ncbi:glycosyltransferase family 4 protein [Faunimonas sp. B44]|uniref:glycosyltransferase family 4 protein n=1 Tax=Faunimonas sp. B44 TaxID=3461493 RepID=UPI004044D058
MNGRKLTILHVVRSPIGGIFRHIADLATAQSAAGHRVGVICDSTTGGAFEDEQIAALAPRLADGVQRIPMSRSIGPRDVPATIEVHRLASAMRPDVIHAHGAKGGVYGRLAAALARRDGRPVCSFYAPHGGSLHYDPASLEGRIYFKVERALERLTDGLIHVSRYEQETYRSKVGLPRCPAHVVHNGLRPEEFEAVVPGPDAADFLYIGMMRDLKGVDLFIEALREVAAGRPPIRALLVGDGEAADMARYREQVDRAGLSAAVRFEPPMPARVAFARARTIVVPSRAESLPYIVLEAAAAGLPMIATSVGGIPEIFAGEEDRLVEAGSAAALAAAMRRALDEPGPISNEAAERRIRLKGQFSLAHMAGAIEAIYRSALRARTMRGEIAERAPVPSPGGSGPA